MSRRAAFGTHGADTPILTMHGICYEIHNLRLFSQPLAFFLNLQDVVTFES